MGELFPEAGIARMDLDTTGSKWAHVEILEAFRRREVDILLGTQMIAKGLDFPEVTLVGVVNADVGLHLPDFRASERTFQLLEQVAGRAGRGEAPGEVLVQTSRPRHYALAAAAEHDYVGFAERELADREEPGYPPYCRLANLVISGKTESRVIDAAEELSEWTRRLIRGRRLVGIEVIGSGPLPDRSTPGTVEVAFPDQGGSRRDARRRSPLSRGAAGPAGLGPPARDRPRSRGASLSGPSSCPLRLLGGPTLRQVVPSDVHPPRVGAKTRERE